MEKETSQSTQRLRNRESQPHSRLTSVDTVENGPRKKCWCINKVTSGPQSGGPANEQNSHADVSMERAPRIVGFQTHWKLTYTPGYWERFSAMDC